MTSTSVKTKSTGFPAWIGIACMSLVAIASPAMAQRSAAASTAPRAAVGAELDLLPYASGGYYLSGWIGREHFRLRPVVAKTTLPSFVVQDGFKNADLEVAALIVDYFPRADFRGWWIGAGVEHWRNRVENEGNGGTARWNNTVATVGGGYVWQLGEHFCLNPWAAGHLVVGGPTRVSAGGATHSPKRFTPEVSLKLGWRF